MVEELVTALNNGDQPAAAKLYVDGAIHPLTLTEDSSVVYRLLTIPGGNDFQAENISTTVVEDNAQTTFDLSGDVRRGDSLVGTMTLRLKMQLEKVGQQWKFVPGGESGGSGI